MSEQMDALLDEAGERAQPPLLEALKPHGVHHICVLIANDPDADGAGLAYFSDVDPHQVPGFLRELADQVDEVIKQWGQDA